MQQHVCEAVNLELQYSAVQAHASSTYVCMYCRYKVCTYRYIRTVRRWVWLSMINYSATFACIFTVRLCKGKCVAGACGPHCLYSIPLQTTMQLYAYTCTVRWLSMHIVPLCILLGYSHCPVLVSSLTSPALPPDNCSSARRTFCDSITCCSAFKRIRSL